MKNIFATVSLGAFSFPRSAIVGSQSQIFHKTILCPLNEQRFELGTVRKPIRHVNVLQEHPATRSLHNMQCSWNPTLWRNVIRANVVIHLRLLQLRDFAHHLPRVLSPLPASYMLSSNLITWYHRWFARRASSITRIVCSRTCGSLHYKWTWRFASLGSIGEGRTELPCASEVTRRSNCIWAVDGMDLSPLRVFDANQFGNFVHSAWPFCLTLPWISM